MDGEHEAGRRPQLTRLVRGAIHRLQDGFRALKSWRPTAWGVAEILLLASAFPIYYLVRGIAHTQIDDAIQRGVDIIGIEESLGIFWEVQLQNWALSQDWLMKFLNWFYVFGHLPLIVGLALWLYFWRRPHYLLMRNAFLISGAIALFFYVQYPTAPPRLLPPELGFGFVDTVLDEFENTQRPFSGAPEWFVNEYAALPSMHFGWNTLLGVGVWMASRNVFMRIFAVSLPTLMFMSIVFTANHYFLDAALGLAVMATGLALAVGGKHLARRIVSPDSKAAREKGWVPWFYWLLGAPEKPWEDKPGEENTSRFMHQTA
jgi:hypothetical protein